MESLKKNVVAGVEYTYSSDWINELETKEHWELYWFQQKIMQNKVNAGDHVLEIGPGSGFCSNYLKSKGINVTTLDIDESKNPDIVANIVQYTPATKYDHILGFEVFEHIPYTQFIEILKKHNNNCKYIFLSVPKNEVRIVELNLRLPIIKWIHFLFTFPRFKIVESNHFWEIGYGRFKEQKVVNDIKSAGYKVVFKKNFKSRLFLILKNCSKKVEN